jgi:3-hydroxyisobutyrate dehydrogenase-like beta-hydroxyacid dehydrogenase
MRHEDEMVGVIGAGRMGGAVVQRLAEVGYRVGVFDQDPEMARRASGFGALPFGSAAELADSCPVVFLSLPSDEAAASAVDGLLSGQRSSTDFIFDLSTVSPSTSVRNASRCDAANLDYCDAPVIGGIGNCGRWTLLVGASELRARPRPVLEALGRPFFLGRIGTGSSLKLINNMMLPILVGGIREMVELAVASGIAPETMCEILTAAGSVTLSRVFTETLPRALAGQPAGNFAMFLLDKDTRLAAELSETLRVPTPTLRAARSANLAAATDLAPQADFGELFRRAARSSSRPS